MTHITYPYKAVRRLLWILVLVSVFSEAIPAQTVAGIWRGKTPSGLELTLELEVDGQVLTGTLTRGQDRGPIADGRVVDGKVGFSVTLRGQTASFSGEWAGDELTLMLDGGGPQTAVVFKRAK